MGGLALRHLHDEHADAVRSAMVAELDRDLAVDRQHRSAFLNTAGHAVWPLLLGEALENGDDQSLAEALAEPGYWQAEYVQHRASGPVIAAVPRTAGIRLSQGQFGFYYLCAVCAVAVTAGREVRVIRLREVSNPRSASESKLSQVLDPAILLADLRARRGIDTALGIPTGPNSGLGVEIV